MLDQGRRSLDIAEKLDNDFSRVIGYFTLGMAYLLDQQPTSAREALQKGASIARERRTMLCWLPLLVTVQSEAHMALGERVEAMVAAREGIDRARTGGCIYHEAAAQLALVQILLATDGEVPRVEIEAALDRAEELVAAVEGRSLSPRILELHGRLAAALGDMPGAGQALREALDLYRMIGATGHAARLALEIQPTSSQGEQP